MQDHQQIQQFQSTFPVWGTTSLITSYSTPSIDFNPRSPCGERLGRWTRYTATKKISIHVPRVGNDAINLRQLTQVQISIHVPRVGNDPGLFAYLLRRQISIHVPRAGNDLLLAHIPALWIAISIHVPRVGNDAINLRQLTQVQISIHVPRVGNDDFAFAFCFLLTNFNPRSPCGERPSRTALKPSPLFISIHVPRVGNDHKWYISGIFAIIISIHVPRVGNDNNHKTEQPNLNKFQSTFPVWGTTGSCCRQSSRSNHFNPRSPCGERLLSC